MRYNSHITQSQDQVADLGSGITDLSASSAGNWANDSVSVEPAEAAQALSSYFNSTGIQMDADVTFKTAFVDRIFSRKRDPGTGNLFFKNFFNNDGSVDGNGDADTFPTRRVLSWEIPTMGQVYDLLMRPAFGIVDWHLGDMRPLNGNDNDSLYFLYNTAVGGTQVYYEQGDNPSPSNPDWLKYNFKQKFIDILKRLFGKSTDASWGFNIHAKSFWGGSLTVVSDVATTSESEFLYAGETVAGMQGTSIFQVLGGSAGSKFIYLVDNNLISSTSPNDKYPIGIAFASYGSSKPYETLGASSSYAFADLSRYYLGFNNAGVYQDFAPDEVNLMTWMEMDASGYPIFRKGKPYLNSVTSPSNPSISIKIPFPYSNYTASDHQVLTNNIKFGSEPTIYAKPSQSPNADLNRTIWKFKFLSFNPEIGYALTWINSGQDRGNFYVTSGGASGDTDYAVTIPDLSTDAAFLVTKAHDSQSIISNILFSTGKLTSTPQIIANGGIRTASGSYWSTGNIQTTSGMFSVQAFSEGSVPNDIGPGDILNFVDGGVEHNLPLASYNSSTHVFVLASVAPISSGLDTYQILRSMIQENGIRSMIRGSATGITGDELETLSSGPTSNADPLHTHNFIGSAVFAESYGSIVIPSGFISSARAIDDSFSAIFRYCTPTIIYPSSPVLQKRNYGANDPWVTADGVFTAPKTATYIIKLKLNVMLASAGDIPGIFLIKKDFSTSAYTKIYANNASARSDFYKNNLSSSNYNVLAYFDTDINFETIISLNTGDTITPYYASNVCGLGYQVAEGVIYDTGSSNEMRNTDQSHISTPYQYHDSNYSAAQTVLKYEQYDYGSGNPESIWGIIQVLNTGLGGTGGTDISGPGPNTAGHSTITFSAGQSHPPTGKSWVGTPSIPDSHGGYTLGVYAHCQFQGNVLLDDICFSAVEI